MGKYADIRKHFTDNGDDTMTVTVQPVTLEGLERFSLWNNNEKKYYNENETVEIEGEDKPVSECRFVKNTVLAEHGFTRNLKVQRAVIIDGEELIVQISPTAEEKLLSAMSIVKQMEQDPLDYSYNIIKKITGKLPTDVEYEVTLNKSTAKTKVKPKKVVKSEELDLELDDEPVALTSREKTIIAAIKKQVPDYQSRGDEYLGRLIKKNAPDIKESRADFLIQKLLE